MILIEKEQPAFSRSSRFSAPDFFQNDDEPSTDFESEYRQNILLKLLDVLDLEQEKDLSTEGIWLLLIPYLI